MIPSGANRLGFNLLHLVPSKNLFLSPHSIWTALAMVREGAALQTRTEMDQVLGIDAPDELHRRSVAELSTALASRSKPRPELVQELQWAAPNQDPSSLGFQLVVANRMFQQSGYPIKPAFLQILSTIYASTADEVDFAGAPDEAVRHVNAWIAEATNDRLQNVLQQVAPLTRAIIANAIYFKARWKEPFFEHATRDEPFHLPSGKQVSIPMMCGGDLRRYQRSNDFEAVRLPYTGDELAMWIILPHQGRFDAVESRLPDCFEDTFRQAQPAQVTLWLPRFQLRWERGLGPLLSDLGMARLFTPEAELADISDEPGFLIDDVIHSTFVSVDEQGTEAAAVTLAVAAGEAMPEKPVELRVDRPFLFAIRDDATGTVLFLGRVVDPRG